MVSLDPIEIQEGVAGPINSLYIRIPLGVALMAIGLIVALTVKDNTGTIPYSVVAVGGGLQLVGIAVIAGLVE